MLTFIGQTRKTRRMIERPLNSRKHGKRNAPLRLKNSRATTKEASGTPLSAAADAGIDRRWWLVSFFPFSANLNRDVAELLGVPVMRFQLF